MFGLNLGFNKSSTNSTSTINRNLTPEQQAALSGLSSYGTDLMTNPMEAVKPLRDASFGKVNQLFDAAPDQIAERLRSKGLGGNSGLRRRLSELDMLRYGSLAGVENNLNGLALNLKAQGADILGNLLAQNFSSTQTGKSSTGGFSFGVGGGR